MTCANEFMYNTLFEMKRSVSPIGLATIEIICFVYSKRVVMNGDTQVKFQLR